MAAETYDFVLFGLSGAAAREAWEEARQYNPGMPAGSYALIEALAKIQTISVDECAKLAVQAFLKWKDATVARVAGGAA